VAEGANLAGLDRHAALHLDGDTCSPSAELLFLIRETLFIFVVALLFATCFGTGEAT